MRASVSDVTLRYLALQETFAISVQLTTHQQICQKFATSSYNSSMTSKTQWLKFKMAAAAISNSENCFSKLVFYSLKKPFKAKFHQIYFECLVV